MEKTELQAQMLANRLSKKFKHLSKWAKRCGTWAFRLYDRDIPEIPLVLDYYGDGVSQGAVSGALYNRPYEKDEKEEEAWLEAMRKAVSEALGINPADIFLKRRLRQRGGNQYNKQSNRTVVRTVNENGLQFKVNLSDYLDTGFFPDRRLMRSKIKNEAAGKKVLNLFCYTATYSVAAAAGGAEASCSVDMSNTYLDWALENFRLNKIKTRITDSRDNNSMLRHSGHQLVRANVLVFLREARTARCKWDIIVLDPPAFSNSKKMKAVKTPGKPLPQTLDLKRDHLELIEQCLELLEEGGKLWFSLNARGFSTDADALETALKSKFPQVKVLDLTKKLTDEDFKGKKIPRTFLIGSSCEDS